MYIVSSTSIAPYPSKTPLAIWSTSPPPLLPKQKCIKISTDSLNFQHDACDGVYF